MADQPGDDEREAVTMSAGGGLWDEASSRGCAPATNPPLTASQTGPEGPGRSGAVNELDDDG